MKKALYFFLTFFISLQMIVAAEESVFLSLKDHLSDEQVQGVANTLQEKVSDDTKRLVIEVNSSSGDLSKVLDLARYIYSIKSEKDIKVIVYINTSAIGPAAMIPFLADELYISFFMTWGDIAVGSETTIPTNILRNRVTSLVPQDSPNVNLLKLMAAAMADKTIIIIDDNGWKIGRPDSKEVVVSAENEALVVNHNQIKKLDLVSGVMAEKVFKSRFGIQKSQEKLEEEKTQDERGEPKLSVLNELKKHIKYKPGGPNNIGLIRIDDKKSQISQATWIYVKNALDYYKKTKPAFVILDLNTPGGEVFSAQKISDALKELDTQNDIPVVAFIDNWAISAGAMLAYSARFIAVVKDASMGAAEPVIASKEGMVTASEKVNSALRADFANRASFFDRNPDIAEAMVDKDVILVKRFGKIIRLDSEDQIRKEGPNPDQVLSAKGKLLTLNTQEMLRHGVADIYVPPYKLEPITAKEAEEKKWPANKSLLFHTTFFNKIPDAFIDEYRMDWKTQFFVLLSNPIVSSMIFLGMILGFYVEINTPGFGFAGSVALICLFLIVLSSFALEVASMLELILLLAGLAFIVLDLVLIPTFGILGFIGIALFVAGLFGMMLPGIGSIDFEFDTQTFNAAGEAFIKRLGWLSGTVVVAVVIMAFLGRFIKPTFSAFKRITLTGGEQTGYIAGEPKEKLPETGDRGEVLATLRPAGKVIVKEKIYDAVTAGEFIEKGTPIKVVEISGSVIIVDSVEEGK